MRILLLMDNRRDRNWGSQATTQALVGLLKERYPEAEIVGAPRTATDPGKFWRKRVEAWAPEAMRREGATFIDRLALRLVSQKLEGQYASADLVVVNGEGTLHPQRQTRRWLPAIDHLHRRYRKPLWIVNSTVETGESQDAWQFERVLREADRVVVRDAISHRSLPVPSILAADCAYLTKAAAFVPPIEGPYAVMTGTASVRHWPLDAFRNAVETLQGEGLKVVYTASDRLDFDLPERLGLPLAMVTDRDASPQELMGLQAGAAILVGGRYHPTILAALAGTPFVSLTSNTSKTVALMAALGAEELLVSPGEAERLPTVIRGVLRDRSAWSARLAEAAAAQAPLARLNVFES